MSVSFLGCLLAWGGAQTPVGVTATVTLVALMFLRPGILGEQFGPLGAGLLFCTLLVTYRRGSEQPPRSQLVAVAICLGLPVALGGALSTSGLSGVFVTPLVALAAWHLGRHRLVVDRLVSMLALLAAQQSLALVLTSALSFPATRYVMVGGPRDGTGYLVSRLGAITSGTGGSFQFIDGRLTGPFGEPGVFAAVLVCAAALSLGLGQRWRPLVQLPIISAIVLTQSLAGLSTYVAAVAVFVGWSAQRSPSGKTTLQQRSARVAAGAGGVWAATHTDRLLQAKQEANRFSITDRLGGISLSRLASSWIQYPFGKARNGVNSSINLLQASITYGPTLFAAGIALYLWPLLHRRPTLVAPIVATLMLTVLFSQPPFLYSWIFFAFVTSALASPVSQGDDMESGDARVASASV